jgi:hypothetical protein
MQLHDPLLGTLTCDEGRLWHGEIRIDGRRIKFWISGTQAAPSPILHDKARHELGDFKRHEAAAVGFLRALLPPREQAVFTSSGIGFTWERFPDSFYMEFDLEGDSGAIWRVEFAGGIPKYSGRDD